MAGHVVSVVRIGGGLGCLATGWSVSPCSWK